MLTGQRATRLSPIYVTGCRGDELRGGGGKSGRAVLYANIPQGMGLQSRAWCLSPAQGAPPFLGGGLEQLRLLRDRPPPQLRSHQDQGLQRDQPPGTVWEREGLCEGPAQRERAPDVAEAGGQGPCGGADARGGRAWSSPAQLTWARTQATEAELLVSREDVGAPVPAGPRGTVGPQAALPAHPAAAGAGLPGGPGGPGTVPSHAARARAQRQLCATGRSSAGASPSPSRRSPGADPSSGSAMTSRTPHTDLTHWVPAALAMGPPAEGFGWDLGGGGLAHTRPGICWKLAGLPDSAGVGTGPRVRHRPVIRRLAQSAARAWGVLDVGLGLDTGWGLELVVRGRRLGSEGTVGSQTRSGSEVGTRGSTCTGRQVAGALLGSVPPGAVRQAEAGAAAPSRERRVRAAPGAGGPWGPRAPATWGDRRERRLPMSQPWAPGPQEAGLKRQGPLGSLFPKGKGVRSAGSGSRSLGYLEGLSPVPPWTLQHLCQRKTLLRNVSQAAVHQSPARGWRLPGSALPSAWSSVDASSWQQGLGSSCFCHLAFFPLQCPSKFSPFPQPLEMLPPPGSPPRPPL